MGYTIKSSKDKGVIKLNCQKELMSLRKDIENNVQHRGKNYEVCFAAYTEINVHYGYAKPNSTCRTGCIRQMNIILINWFKAFDSSGGIMPVESNDSRKSPNSYSFKEVVQAESGGNLISIDSRRETLLAWDWAELKAHAVTLLGKERIKALNGNKPAKKSQIVEELLKL